MPIKLPSRETVAQYANIGSFVVALIALAVCVASCYISFLSLQVARHPVHVNNGASSALQAVHLKTTSLLPWATIVLAILVAFFAVREISRYLSERKQPHLFDAELYRIATSPKNAFAGLTGQIIEGMGKKFVIDADVLVDMYVVNVSANTQYIKDFTATVEIDGQRVDLIRQKDFYAYDVNETDYEYCLDPKPDEGAFQLEARAEALVPLFSSMPMAIEPRQPLKGWVHFLLPKVELKRLEENRSYIFTLTDSFGRQHPITRSVRVTTDSRIKTRRVVGAKR